MQYSISSAKWPSSDYEVLIAEQKKMKLLGNNITYDAYTAATLTADDNKQGRIEDIKNEISSNFLKVKHTSGVSESIAALDQFRPKQF